MRLHNALFRLGFPTATPQRVTLPTHHDSQAHAAKGTPSQPPKGPLCRLDSTRFQVLFHHPSPGHFSPFPHGTSALSVTRTYFGLTGGPARFTRNSSSSVLLGNTPTPRLFLHLRDCHPLRYRFLTASARKTHSAPGRQTRKRCTPQPHTRNDCRLSHAHGLASSPFAHHY